VKRNTNLSSSDPAGAAAEGFRTLHQSTSAAARGKRINFSASNCPVCLTNSTKRSQHDMDQKGDGELPTGWRWKTIPPFQGLAR
jgi:hypothetical protein